MGTVKASGVQSMLGHCQLPPKLGLTVPPPRGPRGVLCPSYLVMPRQGWQMTAGQWPLAPHRGAATGIGVGGQGQTGLFVASQTPLPKGPLGYIPLKQG